jgi:hypothetical protein
MNKIYSVFLSFVGIVHLNSATPRVLLDDISDCSLTSKEQSVEVIEHHQKKHESPVDAPEVDVCLPVEIPEVKIPEVEVPEVKIPEVEVPEVDGDENIRRPHRRTVPPRTLQDLNRVQRKLVRHNEDANYLARFANDNSFVTGILTTAQRNPACREEGLSCLEMLERAANVVEGFAPVPLQIALRSLKYAAKGVSLIAQKSRNKLRDMKCGDWKSLGDNNIVHVAVKYGTVKLAAWSITNCLPIVFSQINAQGYTPQEFACLRIQLLTDERDGLIKQKDALANRVLAQRAPLVSHISIPACDREITKFDKKILKINTIISMLESAELFHSSVSEQEPEETPRWEDALERLRAAQMSVNAVLTHFDSLPPGRDLVNFRQNMLSVLHQMLELNVLTSQLLTAIEQTAHVQLTE